MIKPMYLSVSCEALATDELTSGAESGYVISASLAR